jgi:hypothetical protein
MVKIHENFASVGRNFGNKLFTYGVSKLIADEYGYKLEVPKNSLIQRNNEYQTFPYNGCDGITINGTQYNITDGLMVELGFDEVLKNSKDKNLIVDGYFLKYENIKSRKEKIRNYYKNLVGEKDKLNDVIILLRDSNIDPTFKLPNYYYLEIIESLVFDKLYISYDHINKHQILINQLSKYNPTLLDLNIIELMKYITTKKTIIGCQGTFSFWSCFLSTADVIYWPLTEKGPNSIDKHVNLTVDDDERYKFIKINNK